MPVVRYGKASLLDLFDGRHQLIICHFMLDPDVSEGCPDCSHLVDNIPIWRIYTQHTSLVLVSRAPPAKTAPFQAISVGPSRGIPRSGATSIPISTSPRMKPSPASRTII